MTALPGGVEGHVAPGFEPVARALAGNVDRHGEVGAAVHVLVRGEPVVDCWTGWADADRTRPWRADTLVNAYSVGKPLAATLVLQLVDEGRIGLDDPVAAHWPGFERGGKETATIRHLLCHRAGVPAIRRRLDDDDLLDTRTMVDAVAGTAAWWVPGQRHAYHTNTFGHLTAGVLLAVTGHGAGHALATRIAGPLGADVHCGVPETDLARCAEVLWDGPVPGPVPDDLFDAPDDDAAMTLLGYVNPPGYSSLGVVNTTGWRRAEIPSTNCHASARGVATVYEALRTGTLLSPDLLAEATRTQSAGWCPTLGREASFGLGFQPWTATRPLGRTPGSFGHYGTGGSLGYCDPTRGVALGYVMNHVVPRWQSPRNAALVDALYACLDGRA